jgi:DNA-binding MarR family transcriptional regulator
MEKAGLIDRQIQEQDHRANRLRVKASGRTKYEKAREIAVRLQSKVLGALPSNAREEFLANLDRIADACQASAVSSPQRRARVKRSPA